MSIRGSRNSSITRVRPVFGHLLSVDPTGREWLSQLWTLAANRQPESGIVRRPPIMGSLIAGEVTGTRPFKDPILRDYGYPVIELSAAFERRLPPPAGFLSWLLQHPSALVRPPQGYGASGENERMREQFFQRGPGHVSARNGNGA